MADSLAAALAELQANPPRIRKRAKGQYGKYADLPDVHKILMPVLSTLGLLWETDTGYSADDWGVHYKLSHLKSGEFKAGFWPVETRDPQKQGSAVTYARRYALVTVTGVTPEGDDDDGQKASGRGRAPDEVASGEVAPARNRTRTTGAEHERLRYGTVEPTPDDRPAERVRPGDIPPVDMWMDNPPTESDEQPEERPGSVTAEQLRKLGIAFTKAGIADKAVRLGMVSDMIGRTVMSSKQLSQVEYEFIIKRIKDGEQP